MLDLQTIVSGSFVLMSARPKPKRRPHFDLELNSREYMRVGGVNYTEQSEGVIILYLVVDVAGFFSPDFRATG